MILDHQLMASADLCTVNGGSLALLIHSNDTDAATSFTDSGASKAITTVGDAQHDTAQKKFGLSAMLFDGTGDKLTTPGHSDFVVSSSTDLTIDFWFKMASAGAAGSFCGGTTWTAVNDTSWLIDFQYNGGSGAQYIRWANYTNECKYTWGNSADTNWHHLALVADSGTQELFLDGVSVATSSHASTWGSASANFQIGDSGLTQAYNGHIDEFRVTKSAVWTSAFTPPTLAYCNS